MLKFRTKSLWFRLPGLGGREGEPRLPSLQWSSPMLLPGPLPQALLSTTCLLAVVPGSSDSLREGKMAALGIAPDLCCLVSGYPPCKGKPELAPSQCLTIATGTMDPRCVCSMLPSCSHNSPAGSACMLLMMGSSRLSRVANDMSRQFILLQFLIRKFIYALTIL